MEKIGPRAQSNIRQIVASKFIEHQLYVGLIKPGEDDAGRASVIVDVRHAIGPRELDATLAATIVQVIRDYLLSEGDDRLPCIAQPPAPRLPAR